MPGWLDSELQERGRLNLTAAQYTFPLHEAPQATLTVPEDCPAGLRDWISLYGPEGLLGVYRVTNTAQNVGRHIQMTLLHGIDILSDSVWTPATAGAASEDFSGTMTQYLTALLDRQTALINGVKPWILGTCESTETVEKTIAYTRLYDLLMDAAPEGGDYYFEYNQTSFPWTVSLKAKPAGVTAEFRVSRNLVGATVTYDDTELCTQLILSNTNGETSRIRTYSAGMAAQNRWGVVTKIASIDTGDTLSAQSWPEAEAWVADFFRKRAAPNVQVQITGLELKAQTGEVWDKADLGRLCRVALPDYGITLEERVVSVTYPNPLNDPERVTVSLANGLPTFSETIKLLQKTANSAASRAGAAAAKADQTAEALDEHRVVYQTSVQKTDREIAGIASATGLQFNADGTPVVDPETGEFVYSETHPDNALIAQIQLQAGRYDRIIQATGISETPEQGEVSLVTQVSQTHQQISQAAIATGLVWDASLNNGAGGFKVDPNAISSSVYKQLAGQISQKVTASDVATQVEAYGYTTLTAATNAASAMIGADLKDANGVITSAKIKALVEGDTSLIQLVANQVQITAGDVTISGNIKLDSVITIENGVAKGTFGSLVITGGANLGSTNVYFNSVPLASFIKSISLTGPTNNEYTLTWENAGGNSTSKTFSRAASGVTVSWSGTTGTVTVNPQNQNFTITYPGPSSASVDSITITNTPLTGTLYTGSGGTRYAQTTENLTAWHNESDGEGGTTQTSLLDTSATVRVNIESILSAAENAIKVTGPTWGSSTTNSSNTATFTTDAPTPVSGAAKELKLYLSRSNDWTNNVRTVYLSHTDSSAANRVAQIEVDASTLVSNAVSTALGNVTVSGTWNSGAITIGSSANNTTIVDYLRGGTASWNGTTVTVPIQHSTTPASEQSFANTGQSVSVNVSGKLTTATITPTSSAQNNITPQTLDPNSTAIGFSSVTIAAASGGSSVVGTPYIDPTNPSYVFQESSTWPKGYYEITPKVEVDGAVVSGSATKIDAYDAWHQGYLDGTGGVVPEPNVTTRLITSGWDSSITTDEGTISAGTTYAVRVNVDGTTYRYHKFTTPSSTSHSVEVDFSSFVPSDAVDKGTLDANTTYCVRGKCGSTYAYIKFKTPASSSYSHSAKVTKYTYTTMYYLNGSTYTPITLSNGSFYSISGSDLPGNQTTVRW